MMKRLASDLSPAQILIKQISCQSCQHFVIEAHFRQAVLMVETHDSLQGWQKKRLFALLSPMYLEMKLLMLNNEIQQDNPLDLAIDELLLEYHLNDLSTQLACTHQGATQLEDPLLRTSLVNLKKIFNEVLGEKIF